MRIHLGSLAVPPGDGISLHELAQRRNTCALVLPPTLSSCDWSTQMPRFTQVQIQAAGNCTHGPTKNATLADLTLARDKRVYLSAKTSVYPPAHPPATTCVRPASVLPSPPHLSPRPVSTPLHFHLCIRGASYDVAHVRAGIPTPPCNSRHCS